MATKTDAGYAWLYYDTGARYADVSERALRRAVQMGKVEHCRIGLRVRFTREMLDKWIADSTRGAVAS